MEDNASERHWCSTAIRSNSKKGASLLSELLRRTALQEARPTEQTSELLARLVTSSKRATVAFLSANSAYIAYQHHELVQAFECTSIVLPDGVGIRLLSRFAGQTIRTNVPGTDLVPRLLNDKHLSGKRVFLLGHIPDAHDSLIHGFKDRFPNVNLVGWHHGFFADFMNDSIVAAINHTGPDVLLVGMGTPRQETWVFNNSPFLNVPLVISVGGLFQYWTGELKRTPSWLRFLRLEWLWILVHQPWKWHRYCAEGPRLIWKEFVQSYVASL